MKKFIGFFLSFLILFSSTISLAAVGDYIHIGLRKAYTTEDTEELLKDLRNNKTDPKLFYREVENNKYINIHSEQKEEEKILGELLSKAGVDITKPNEIEKFVTDENNLKELEKKIKDMADSLSMSFDEIEDENKGKIEDYFMVNIPKVNVETNEDMDVPVASDKALE